MKPALHPVATVTRVVNGKTITAPAHYFAPDRTKAAMPMSDWLAQHKHPSTR
jgi:hypothetical protein